MQAGTEVVEDLSGVESASSTPAMPAPNSVHPLKIHVMQHRLAKPPCVEPTVRPEQHGTMFARTPAVQDPNPRREINRGIARFESRYRSKAQLPM